MDNKLSEAIWIGSLVGEEHQQGRGLHEKNDHL